MNSGSLGTVYYPWNGFCYDVFCGDEKMQDDPRLEDYNVNDIVTRFIEAARGQAAHYVGGDVLFTAGGDFQYEAALESFTAFDALIHYVNINTSIHGVRAFYSTPELYYDAKAAYPITWPLTDDGSDLYPYMTGPHASMIGFVTSRPALKGYIRTNSFYIAAARPLITFAAPASGPGDDGGSPLATLEEALALAQHHDGVTGTSKRHVARDFAKRLAVGHAASIGGLSDAIGALTRASSVLPSGVTFSTCDLANASICTPLIDATGPVLLAVLNSQSKPIEAGETGLVRVPVGLPQGVVSWAVTDATTATAVPAQLLPSSPADTWLREEYYGAPAATTAWLAIAANNVPALGVLLLRLVPVATAADAPSTSTSVVTSVAPGVTSNITNGQVTLLFDTSGSLSRISVPGVNSTPFVQSWLWYNASKGDKVAGDSDDHGGAATISGAYVWRPATGTVPTALGAPSTLTLVTGPLVSEARQTWGGVPGEPNPNPDSGSWVAQSLRLWSGGAAVDAEWTVGPLPIDDDTGREVVSRWSSPSVPSAGQWTTDANCRDMVLRRRNARSTFVYNGSEPAASNFAPVACAIAATGGGISLAVVTDRAEAGGSLADGSLELMVRVGCMG